MIMQGIAVLLATAAAACCASAQVSDVTPLLTNGKALADVLVR